MIQNTFYSEIWVKRSTLPEGGGPKSELRFLLYLFSVSQNRRKNISLKRYDHKEAESTPRLTIGVVVGCLARDRGIREQVESTSSFELVTECSSNKRKSPSIISKALIHMRKQEERGFH